MCVLFVSYRYPDFNICMMYYMLHSFYIFIYTIRNDEYLNYSIKLFGAGRTSAIDINIIHTVPRKMK